MAEKRSGFCIKCGIRCEGEVVGHHGGIVCSEHGEDVAEKSCEWCNRPIATDREICADCEQSVADADAGSRIEWE